MVCGTCQSTKTVPRVGSEYLDRLCFLAASRAKSNRLLLWPTRGWLDARPRCSATATSPPSVQTSTTAVRSSNCPVWPPVVLCRTWHYYETVQPSFTSSCCLSQLQNMMTEARSSRETPYLHCVTLSPWVRVWLNPMHVLSESLLCHSTAVEVCLCLVLYCVGDLNHSPAELQW